MTPSEAVTAVWCSAAAVIASGPVEIWPLIKTEMQLKSFLLLDLTF